MSYSVIELIYASGMVLGEWYIEDGVRGWLDTQCCPIFWVSLILSLTAGLLRDVDLPCRIRESLKWCKHLINWMVSSIFVAQFTAMYSFKLGQTACKRSVIAPNEKPPARSDLCLMLTRSISWARYGCTSGNKLNVTSIVLIRNIPSPLYLFRQPQ